MSFTFETTDTEEHLASVDRSFEEAVESELTIRNLLIQSTLQLIHDQLPVTAGSIEELAVGLGGNRNKIHKLLDQITRQLI